jgi:NAD(P)-dependent dehydrogenase (short-subunit alcohol dehydrogenase family)
MLARALLAGDHEDRQAFRDGARFVARIEPARDVPHGSEPTALRADATYLVTGGLGGLGLAVAEWMIASGARHLVLVGRSEPKPDARKRLATLTADGAVVIDLRVDVADADAVQQLYAHIAANMPPLRGVVHAAGLVDDAAAAEVAWDRCARVLAPKIQGVWNLHVHAPALDFFTLFSSTSSVLGMPGQIAYAAGNAFMDALAHERRAAGLAATSINWGPWRDAGMAAGAPYGARLG